MHFAFLGHSLQPFTTVSFSTNIILNSTTCINLHAAIMCLLLDRHIIKPHDPLTLSLICLEFCYVVFPVIVILIMHLLWDIRQVSAQVN